ncbi:hypothetical protein AQUCO_00201199v1 [Aquilegia coerulea]|uniref:Xyloglucan endotransglucosylase/hydrolase n=1 Tax=Aquilegia coerulea TaxID=218851 RepID=A0A2G5F6R0_AQUCA|nr:hypothetical protein AQUCO_00201199v1 [Aquilegia coerulea]
MKLLFCFLFFFYLQVNADLRSELVEVFGGNRFRLSEDGSQVQLSLDKESGSGFKSKNEYLFGKLEMQIKLVPGDSAGTVTTFYLQSAAENHDEIDFEFLGNVSGEPFILHTNIYTKGKDKREQQFYLWFDPRADFHTYSILWNPQQILFSVDGIPIRVYRNAEARGVPYPKDQPMRLFSTIWSADWATRGGLVQTNWSHAPFTASYRKYGADACVWTNEQSFCSSSREKWWNQVLAADGEKKLEDIQKKYMIYNYCKDVKRFPRGLPPECSLMS